MKNIKYQTVNDRFIRTDITSQFIKEEIKRGADRSYIESLLTIEHWILTGNDRCTYDGLSIPYFSNSHPSQLAKKYHEAYRQIFIDNKGMETFLKEEEEKYKSQVKQQHELDAMNNYLKTKNDEIQKVKDDMLIKMKYDISNSDLFMFTTYKETIDKRFLELEKEHSILFKTNK